ncbi:putative pilus assembly protein [Deinococcus grandis]|uniref:Putative pilus assembly protein n=1 Tax=Deinococcus grandis TaxID=57498 RepID=A0A124BR60_9DEIO|nr:prepilin-type N-terminal cleavage/methylation domain-containing protein [Deinococcus grandis]BBN96334.1 pili assembly chaperone [Deinococcus grandis]GAQ20187.1 putative pilus assembly protein [Deinococcus grandis]
MNARAGFTLVELLIVLAILGILMSIGFSSLLRQIRTNEVADGARQFGGDLTVLRDGAQRHSVSSGLNWNTAASGDLTTYTLTNNGQTSSRTVNSKVKITCIEPVATVCTPRTLTFNAPFSEMSSGAVFRVQHAISSIPPIYVKVTGVTGKVMYSAQP